MGRILQEFLELVQINSDTRNERQMADLLTKKLLEIGCQVTEDDVGEKIGGNTGNLYAVLEGGLPGSVLLSAHMDRVPGGHDIKPVIQGDTLVSSGETILAADDLAGVCAVLDGLRRLKAAGEPHCTVEILFTVSEEAGLKGSRNMDYSKIRSQHGYAFDSSGRVGRLIVGAPSKANIEVRFYGKSAHAGNEPEAGIDAAKLCGRFLAALDSGRLDPETVSNFPIVRTGSTATNIVCDFAQVLGEARSRDHSKLEAYLQYIHNTAAEIEAGSGGKIEVDTQVEVYGFRITKDMTVVAKAAAAMQTLGITPNVSVGGGCMDANWFNRNGVQAIGVATGYMNNHTTNELLHIPDLSMSGRLAEALIKEYSK